MVGKKAQAELDKKLEQARQIMTSIMEADESGQVTIGYGPAGLRIEHTRHEKPVPVIEKLMPADVGERTILSRHKR